MISKYSYNFLVDTNVVHYKLFISTLDIHKGRFPRLYVQPGLIMKFDILNRNKV